MAHTPWHNVTKQYEEDRKHLEELKKDGYNFESISSFKLALSDIDFVKNLYVDNVFTVKILAKADRTYILNMNNKLYERILMSDKYWVKDQELEDKFNKILQDTINKIKYEKNKQYKLPKDYNDLKIVIAIIVPIIIIIIGIFINYII